MASLLTSTPSKLCILKRNTVSLHPFRCNNSILKPQKSVKVNGGLHTRACSTSPFVGRVGLQRREGNVSLLSFGINTGSVADVSKKDSSQVLSAMLPFVVAATAVAALAQPATFTWWVPFSSVVLFLTC